MSDEQNNYQAPDVPAESQASAPSLEDAGAEEAYRSLEVTDDAALADMATGEIFAEPASAEQEQERFQNLDQQAQPAPSVPAQPAQVSQTPAQPASAQPASAQPASAQPVQPQVPQASTAQPAQAGTAQPTQAGTAQPTQVSPAAPQQPAQPTQVQPTQVSAAAAHYAQQGAQASYQVQVAQRQQAAPAQPGYPQAPQQAPYQQGAYQHSPQQGQSTQQAQQRQTSYGQPPQAAYQQPYQQSYQGRSQQQPIPQQSYVQAQQPAQPEKKQRIGLKSSLFGLAGGAVGALAMVMALRGAGLIGSTHVITQTQSAAGQTISITAKDQDITVSQAVAAKALPSVVSVYVTSSEGSGLGSGVILDTDGNILTNWHVAGNADSISVTIGNKSYDATLVGGDASSDLAVIRAELDGDEVTPIEVGDSNTLVVGDWVMTIGSPFGLDQSVSAGIVSSLARNEMMQSTYGTTIYANLIQTDASINPGNSGGALVNSKGQLVGISTLFSSDTESFAGIGFAIPGNYAVEIANKIIAGEQVTHAYIGLSMQTVNAQNAEANKLSVNQGAYVVEVTKDSPADKVGIKEGDIVIALDGQQIASADGMILAVRSHSIGETVPVTVVRGEQELTFDVTLGSDEALQALQQQQQEERQREEQQNPQGNGYGGNGDGGYEDLLEELYEYLYNNNGGSNTLGR